MNESNISVPQELPESFLADFNSSKSAEVSMAMAGLGGFHMVEGLIPNEGTVIFRGTRADGTKITITFERGDDYMSPAELRAKDDSTEQQSNKDPVL